MGTSPCRCKPHRLLATELQLQHWTISPSVLVCSIRIGISFTESQTKVFHHTCHPRTFSWRLSTGCFFTEGLFLVIEPWPVLCRQIDVRRVCNMCTRVAHSITFKPLLHMWGGKKGAVQFDLVLKWFSQHLVWCHIYLFLQIYFLPFLAKKRQARGCLPKNPRNMMTIKTH